MRPAAVLALVATLSACSSPPPPAPARETKIALAPDPRVEGEYGGEWPDFLRRATCVVVPSPGSDVSDPEAQAFSDAFSEVFFGRGSPFSRTDDPTVAKAAKRRALLGATPDAAALSRLADREKVDFVVLATLTLDETSSEIRASTSCRMSGSADKAAVQLTGGNVSHVQPSNAKQRDELRLGVAGVMGRAAARSMLVALAKLEAPSTENRIAFTFRGFQQDEKSLLRACLNEASAKDDDLEETAPGDDSFGMKVRTKKNIEAFKIAFERSLDAHALRADIERAGSAITVTKRR